MSNGGPCMLTIAICTSSVKACLLLKVDDAVSATLPLHPWLHEECSQEMAHFSWQGGQVAPS